MVRTKTISPVHVWVTISWLANPPKWGCIGLPMLALMYVRQIDRQVLKNIGKTPRKFRTKLKLAAEVDVCAETIARSVAHRSAIQQNFLDVKKVHGGG